MSLIPIFNAIQTNLLNNMSSIFTAYNPLINSALPPYIQLWNNQLKYWRKAEKRRWGKDDMYDVLFPAVMVEFRNLKTERLGDNSMIYPHLEVRLHIVYDELDAGGGTMEQNVNVYDMMDAIQAVMENFRPDIPTGDFIRSLNAPEWDHDNLYHFTVDYVTTWIDYTTPVGLIEDTGVTPVIIIT